MSIRNHLVKEANEHLEELEKEYELPSADRVGKALFVALVTSLAAIAAEAVADKVIERRRQSEEDH